MQLLFAYLFIYINVYVYLIFIVEKTKWQKSGRKIFISNVSL